MRATSSKGESSESDFAEPSPSAPFAPFGDTSDRVATSYVGDVGDDVDDVGGGGDGGGVGGDDDGARPSTVSSTEVSSIDPPEALDLDEADLSFFDGVLRVDARDSIAGLHFFFFASLLSSK